jgi:hypothetical protein
MDGAGAQLQRIYGIYAISRALNLPYIHSPIRKIGYQGLSALESNAECLGVEAQYNRIFDIPSDMALPAYPVVHEVRDASLDALQQIQIEANATRNFALVRILFPYPITDRFPETYRHVKAISPFRQVRSGVFRLGIHVRRGELFAVDSDRMLPNAYYVTCALAIAGILRRLGIPFVCELYTEAPSKPFVVTPRHHGLDGRIRHNVTITPEASRLDDFAVIPNLAKFIGGDPIETLRAMATADALILSRSSYSYVAAILSVNGIVVYHPFWHKPLKDWVISDEHGRVPDGDLVARLEQWKRERL